VKDQDFEFEELPVSEAIGLPLHSFDLVIGPFQGAGGDGVVIEGQDASAIDRQGLAHFDEHGDA
jgi:hypothetical protein